jgi:hypothetical protein
VRASNVPNGSGIQRQQITLSGGESSMRFRFRSLAHAGTRAFAVLALLLGLSGGLTATATAAQTGQTGLDNTWACSVPAGYTYDRVTSQLNTCGSGFHSYYHLRAPQDNIWVCYVLPGYTYDQASNQLNVCNSSGFANSYRMRVGQDNIWACSLPNGSLTYDRVANQLNVCNPSGFANSYHLRTPVNGLWACNVPAGWTYDQVSNQLNVCNPSGFANSYRLRG